MTIEHKEVNELREMINVGNRMTVEIYSAPQETLFDTDGYVVRYNIDGRELELCLQRVTNTARIFSSLDKAVKTIYQTGYINSIVIFNQPCPVSNGDSKISIKKYT
jgi:hypothetical protein